MNNKQKLEDTIKCVWKKMSDERLSTTFEQVKELSYDNPLWKCKYNCKGYELECGGYRVLRK